jgi:hypothetical protein
MLSRRSFLLASGGAAAMAFAPSVNAQRTRSAEPPFTGPLPPSIAALESMTSLVRPITSAEREGRIERARKLMATENIEAIVLTGGTSSQNPIPSSSVRLSKRIAPAKSSPARRWPRKPTSAPGRKTRALTN